MITGCKFRLQLFYFQRNLNLNLQINLNIFSHSYDLFAGGQLLIAVRDSATERAALSSSPRQLTYRSRTCTYAVPPPATTAAQHLYELDGPAFTMRAIRQHILIHELIFYTKMNRIFYRNRFNRCQKSFNILTTFRHDKIRSK